MNPLFQLFLALFWLHFGVPKLVILGSFFGPPKKSAPKTKKTGQRDFGDAGGREETRGEHLGAALGRSRGGVNPSPKGCKEGIDRRKEGWKEEKKERIPEV